MSTSTIPLNGGTISLVSLPTCTGLKSVEFAMTDQVAIVSSPFTGQTQAQQWPGADSWTGTLTLPPLTQDQADDWISFVMELRGMAYAFQVGDPMKRTPRGSVTSSSVPVVDMSTAGMNIAGAQTLYTRGWATNAFGLLLPGDYMQVGYRLHRVLDRVNSDANGKAQISVWPSLREQPTDAEPIVLNNPVGLFRLASNKRTWSADATLLTSLSFTIQEYR
jgi:hypothetical protein